MDYALFENLLHMQETLEAGDPTKALRAQFQSFFDEVARRETIGENPDLLAQAFAQGLCLLRAYYNLQNPAASTPNTVVDLSCLLSDLAFCCDLLCTAWHKRIAFSAGDAVQVVCAPRALIWTTLNLLADAVLYAEGQSVRMRAFSTGGFAGISVSAKSRFSADAFQTAVQTPGSSLRFAARTAELHGGNLLFRTGQNRQACITLSLRQRETDGFAPLRETECTDWLLDRLSPVYTAFCDICPPALF